MKLMTVIFTPSNNEGESLGQLLKCLATVVSLLCVIS